VPVIARSRKATKQFRPIYHLKTIAIPTQFVYNKTMKNENSHSNPRSNSQPIAQPQPQTNPQPEVDILGIYDLDTVLKHAAEGKKDIAQGRWYTPEEAEFLTAIHANSRKRVK
jgi:hypothetical protein